MRALMRRLVDTDELLELRAGFGRGIFTALGRIEGRPVGLIAAGIAVAIIATVQALGTNLNTTFSSVSTAMK